MNTQAVPQCIGLLVGAERQPVPLERVKARASVAGFAGKVTLEQVYRNAEKVPVEAVYVFPLPEAAAVCGLAMRVGDKRIEGRVMGREEAFETYDDALAEGHGAVLLDQERPNVFTASVGNVLPGQEVVVELTFVLELAAEGDAVRFVLPTTVAPRYSPPEDRRGVSPTPAERVSPPVGDAPYGLELSVDVSLPCPIACIDSPSHPVRTELAGEKTRVSFSAPEAAMDRDFVLLVTPKEARKPWVQIERGEEGATAALTFVPRLEAPQEGAEVVFLVDRSGSMEGSSIAEVRRALSLCLRSLREGDRFDVVGFGSTFQSLFKESRSYAQGSLEEASRHVEALDADLGGTEILPALKSVLERSRRDSFLQVLLLTDGEVSNEAAVIELARQHAGHARIFTFGIGHGCSEFLVRALARVTAGAAEFIYPGERIEPKVLRQFARVTAPALTDVALDWGKLKTTRQAPHRVPPLYDGEPVTVYAQAEKMTKTTVELSGKLGSKKLSWKLDVDPAAAREGSVLTTLAARAAIRDLEEGTSALHKEGGSRQADRREEKIRKAIRELALGHSLASSETSFVAVEVREGAKPGEPAELRRIPVALTHGWGGSDEDKAQNLPARPAPRRGLLKGMLRTSAAPPTPQPSAPAPGATGGFGVHASMPMFRKSRDFFDKVCETTATKAQDRPHDALARLQKANGSWALDKSLATALSVPVDKLEEAARSLGVSGDAEALVATAAALRFLREKCAAFEIEWRLLAKKAEAWLAKTCAKCQPPLDVKTLEEKAKAAFE